jgi:hypothetical protein
MHHLYRLRSGFVARFDVDPARIEHQTVTNLSGETHHVLSSGEAERRLFVLQCEYLNDKYAGDHALEQRAA